MNVEVLRDEQAFDGLREEWTELLSRCPTGNIFQTWEWCRAWWAAFGTGSSLYIMAGRDATGRLATLAPFYLCRTTYYGMPVRRIAFLGHGHSDRPDILCREGGEEDQKELLHHLAAAGRAWDLAELDQLASNVLPTAARTVDGLVASTEISSRCPFVRLEVEWDEYLKGLSYKFKRDMKNKYNKLNKQGTWEMKVQDTCVDAKAVLDVMRRVEAESSKSVSQRFLTPANVRFLERFLDYAVPAGWMDFSCLLLRDDVVAYLLGFRYKGAYLAYNMAYRSGYHEFSPGKVLMNEKIRWCMQRRDSIKEFDFLRGGTYVKSLWTDEGRQHLRLVLFRDSPVLRGMRFLVFTLRPLLKHHSQRGRRREGGPEREGGANARD